MCHVSKDENKIFIFKVFYDNMKGYNDVIESARATIRSIVRMLVLVKG